MKIGDLKKIDPDKIFRDNQKREMQRIADLESRSKQLHELIATETFIIDRVVGESYSTSFSPISEIRLGAVSPCYSGGFTSGLILEVSPDDQDIPIRTIFFNGNSIVRVGDWITAQIPRYEEERMTPKFDPLTDKERLFYLDRNFTTEENAIKLALLSPEGRILREDKSINYKNFIRN